MLNVQTDRVKVWGIWGKWSRMGHNEYVEARESGEEGSGDSGESHPFKRMGYPLVKEARKCITPPWKRRHEGSVAPRC